MNLKAKEPIDLVPGTLLKDGRYIIGEQVGAGGFGIVYKAWDTKLETIVAIKEFFVSRLMTRAEGLKEVIVSQKSIEEFRYRKQRFLAEARTMARFGTHKNITNVLEFFEENGTAYIVMELLEGMTLSDYLKQCGGKLDYEFAVEIALEVGNALKSMHENNIIHKDVAPDNIFICSGREIRIKLMDFGAARLADSTDEVIDIILKPGYSPPEQYDKTGSIGPWTDIYALGATLYAILTGVKPDESTNRKTQDLVLPPAQLNPDISENLNNTIMKAMALEPHLRFRNMEELIAAIKGERKVIPLVAEKKRRNLRRALGIIAVCLVIAIGILASLGMFTARQEEVALKPASIAVWFSVGEESDEVQAMETVKADFEATFPGVILELTAIPEEEYEAVLKQAAESGEMPQLFESSGISRDILDRAEDLDKVLVSDQFRTALFLDQYQEYYPDHKQLPLAIEVPMAFVITRGAVGLEYPETYFSAPEDFGADTVLSIDSRCRELVEENFPGITGAPEDEFFNREQNASPVLLSSTMRINEIRDQVTGYTKKYVYCNAEQIRCRYIYEWSIGAGMPEQKEASERLLSWMLGNVYQDILMISRCQDGQIPVHPTSFQTKTENSKLSPLRSVRDRFVFH